MPAWALMLLLPRQPPRRLVCLVDESGSLEERDPLPFRVGFLVTMKPERLAEDIRSMKRDLPPRSRSGEYHACEETAATRRLMRGILGLNSEPRAYVMEWDKSRFSPAHFVNGKLCAFRDTSTLLGSFALGCAQLAAKAATDGIKDIEMIVEAAKADVASEHRGRHQLFNATF